ncbi:proteasome subunit alpha [Rugosimonospora acidiphila]|uniref:Proteasome subunit alpha n=1 Tax=Rugosimonospora acidiphila TaxID=556531 RepID=A0ABP9RM94_9ACTN
MAMQFYASPEQIMRDRSEYARKGIARGRSVIVLSYEGGVLFVTENLSTALHKVSELYDRIGFGAVGRYNEYENLRAAGVRLADLRGYSYDRRDVTARALANFYAQMLGAIFTEQSKPFEVEICVAQVGATPEQDELYRLTYDGSVQQEPGAVVVGGQAEALSGGLRERHSLDMGLDAALRLAVEALGSVGGEGGAPRTLTAAQLEVAILDRRRPGRAFRRITGQALTALLTAPDQPSTAAEGEGDAAAAGTGSAPGDAAARPTSPVADEVSVSDEDATSEGGEGTNADPSGTSGAE